MYLNLDEIKLLQFDHTSRCNLQCPQCPRTNGTTLNTNLPKKDLSINDYKLIFEPFAGKNVGIKHCGNYGDVIASPTFDDTHKWCVDNGFANITITTNGSARSESWWKNLAEMGTKVIFSVDGLEDTNHLYRVNSNFTKIIKNISSFTSAGGIASWDFIAFEHNAHQIEITKSLAKDLGVKRFNVKYSARGIANKNFSVNNIKENTAIVSYNNSVAAFETIEEYYKKTNIACKFKLNNTFFIDFNTRLWPCCWFGWQEFAHHRNSAEVIEIVDLLNKYGNDFNMINVHGWGEIINHPFFVSHLENSWANDSKLKVCGKNCGSMFQTCNHSNTNTIYSTL